MLRWFKKINDYINDYIFKKQVNLCIRRNDVRGITRLFQPKIDKLTSDCVLIEMYYVEANLKLRERGERELDIKLIQDCLDKIKSRINQYQSIINEVSQAQIMEQLNKALMSTQDEFDVFSA